MSNRRGPGCFGLFAFIFFSVALWEGVRGGTLDISSVLWIIGIIVAIALYYLVHIHSVIQREKRRSMTRQPIPIWIKRAVYMRDGGRCRHCKSRANLEYDHIVPWSRGGSDTLGNTQLLCRTCNRRKGNRYVG